MEKKDRYIKFFNDVKKLKNEQDMQKMRGLNDYNLLSTVLKVHDEVRLHSRMIASLLDIYGSHYQKTLFLDIFLKKVGIDDFNSNNSQIYREYENIDIYLTDGKNHIIIENKIWAGEQERQIERYIDYIRKKTNPTISEEKNIEDNHTDDIKIDIKIYVVYLSLDAREPSKYSLGKYKIVGNKIIENEQEIAYFKAISYKKDILKWLEKSKKEVENITNLNESIKQYIDVIKMLNNDYKGRIKPMYELLLKDDNLQLIIQDIEPQVKEAKIKIQTKFWLELQKRLKDKLKKDFVFVNGKYDEIDIWEACKRYYDKKDKNFGLKYDLCSINSEYKLSLYILVEDKIYYGISIIEKNVRKGIANNVKFKDIKEKIKNKIEGKSTDWSVVWNHPAKILNFRDFNSTEIFELKKELFDDSNSQSSIIDSIVNKIKDTLIKFNEIKDDICE